MSGDKRARLRQWLASGEASLHPLTLPQRELWEATPIAVRDPANHICCLIEVRGMLTPRDSELALSRVVERQEVLRLGFLPGKEQPLQLVRRSSEINLAFRDVSPTHTSVAAIEELAQEIFAEPFELVRGPLYRAVILRRAPDHHVIVFAIHHAIADGWTLGVFVHDLFAAYVNVVMNIAEPLPPVPLSYSAWGAVERAFWQPNELAPRSAYWKKTLEGSRPLWAAPAQRVAFFRWVSSVDPAWAQAARALARESGATLFSTLLAAFQNALAEWTDVDDIVVGTPVANRSRHAVRETMGYCAGIVPLRASVEAGRPFIETVRAVHQTSVESFAQAMPFAELVHALGDSHPAGDHPVFQVRFALQNHPVPDVALPALSAKLRMRSTGTARFDLGCEITEQDDALEVVWLYRPNMFSQSAMEELDRMFQNVLMSACRSPDMPASARAIATSR
jgi:hypothetical protein